MNPLQKRLAALRLRLRLAVTARGICLLAGGLLTACVLAGLLDWRMQLPAVARAVLLVAGLGAAGVAACLLLLRPLLARADDLTLALRVEELYPALADSLASAIEFSKEPPQTVDSPELRRAVLKRAGREAQRYDFRRAVPTRGVISAAAGFVVTAAAATALVLWQPSLALTALVRLADPFGSHSWPLATRLEVRTPRSPMARGEPYEIRARISGVIPEEAVLAIDGPAPSRHTFSVGADGNVSVRLDRVEQSFRFSLQANDAVSSWYEVQVLPPPILVALDGRPSPQVRLRFPRYTCLPERDLPDGSGNVDAVAGTQVTLSAAVDRPVAHAWIAYRPDQAAVPTAALLGSLGASNVAGAAVLAAAGADIWGDTPVRLENGGQVLHASFVPRVSGAYALHFEEANGIANSRIFDLRIWPDPAPVVNLERPSRSHDDAAVLADAELDVQVSAADSKFGIRSVVLEERSAPTEPPTRLPLYEHRSAAAAASHPAGALHLQLGRRLALEALRHRDGRPLREGDVIQIQAFADDFDDVSLDKLPGHSHIVELRIVARAALDAELDRAQKQIQQELLRLQKLHREAIDYAIGPEQGLRNTGKLGSRDIDQLAQAQDLEHQLRARVGTAHDGLRGDVARVLERLRDNHLPPSGRQERLETVAGELERLAKEHLEQLESDLANARKESEVETTPGKPQPAATRALTDARRRQDEVGQSLAELLKLLEPWGNVNEAKGEARAALREQRRLAGDTESLKNKTLGRRPEELDDETRAALAKAAETQGRLGQRLDELMQKMTRVGAENRAKSPETSAALEEAATQGRKADIAAQMKAAAADLQENRLGSAGDKQRDILQHMEQMVRALEEHREQELDRLSKKLRQAEERLDDMASRQQALRKQVAAAQKLADPTKRQQELRRLAREQQQLQQQAQEMARELTRLRAEQAVQSMDAASRSMEQAGGQMDRAEDSEQAQDETLDRLNETRRRLRQQQSRVQEELQRERLAKLSDQLRVLKTRQQAAFAEAKRLHDAALEEKAWTRPLRASLRELAETQNDVADDCERLAKEKLAEVKVLPRLLDKAAAAMSAASQRLHQRQDEIDDHPDDLTEDQVLRARQLEALRRLSQLLEVLKNDRTGGPAMSPLRQQSAGDGAASQEARDQPGRVAELKALRLLQQEVAEQTRRFDREHPDLAQLPESAQGELRKLHDAQREVADLLEQLNDRPKAEGENP